GIRRAGGAGSCPTVGGGAVSAAGVQIAAAGERAAVSAPDDHLAASPRCRVSESCSGRAGGGGGRPTVCVGIVSTSGVEKDLVDVVVAAPADHLAACLHCGLPISGIGRAGGAGGYPTIGAGVVSAAGVQIAKDEALSAPDDHYTVGPHCRVYL